MGEHGLRGIPLVRERTRLRHEALAALHELLAIDDDRDVREAFDSLWGSEERFQSWKGFRGSECVLGAETDADSRYETQLRSTKPGRYSHVFDWIT